MPLQINTNNNTFEFQENTRMHLIIFAVEALKDKDYRVDVMKQFHHSYRTYQEYEKDGILFRAVEDMYDESYQKYDNDMSNNVKYNNRKILSVRYPMVLLIQKN